MKPYRKYLLSLLLVIPIGIALAASEPDDEEEEGEVRISLEQTPDNVKATILAELLLEVEGLELLEIEREVEFGQVVYDAEFAYQGREIEFEISATGRLLDKEVEADEFEDDAEEDED